MPSVGRHAVQDDLGVVATPREGPHCHFSLLQKRPLFPVDTTGEGRRPANPRRAANWLYITVVAFVVLASTPSDAGVQYQCRSVTTVCNEYGCSRYCAQWEPYFYPRYQPLAPPERPYYWGDPYYGYRPPPFYERRTYPRYERPPAYDRTCYTDKSYRHDHDNRCDKVFDRYGR